jgi:hypothetical protein
MVDYNRELITDPIEKKIADKAADDSLFAIAFAILMLKDELENIRAKGMWVNDTVFVKHYGDE